jgi:membrane-bound ClpP family serine protease
LGGAEGGKNMAAAKKFMRAGGAVTMLGMVGLVIGAAMLAFSSAFGAQFNTAQQSSVALLVAAVGAAAAIAGVSFVCIGLVLRPRHSGTSKRAVRRASRYVPAVHRETYTRPARRLSQALTGEQQVIPG